MVQLPAMWDITAPTARRQYDYRSDGIYFSGESGLREAAGVAVSAAAAELQAERVDEERTCAEGERNIPIFQMYLTTVR